MTTPPAAMTEDLSKAPACRLGEHKYCHGPRKNYVAGFTVPVETLRCSCPCHRTTSTPSVDRCDDNDASARKHTH